MPAISKEASCSTQELPWMDIRRAFLELHDQRINKGVPPTPWDIIELEYLTRGDASVNLGKNSKDLREAQIAGVRRILHLRTTPFATELGWKPTLHEITALQEAIKLASPHQTPNVQQRVPTANEATDSSTYHWGALARGRVAALAANAVGSRL